MNTIERTAMNGKPVFTVPAKTVVNFHSGFGKKLLCDDLTFTAGSDCAYSCPYCYVEAMQKKQQEWFEKNGVEYPDKGHFGVVIRTRDAVELARKQIMSKPEEFRMAKKVIYSSPKVDVAANMDLVRETVEICKVILELTNWDIRLLSKSNLLPNIAKAFYPDAWKEGQPIGDISAKNRIIYGVSTGTLDDKVAHVIEEGTPFVSKRRGYFAEQRFCNSGRITKMKLFKIGKIWHVEYKPGVGKPMKRLSTRRTERGDAEKMIADAKIEQIEHAALAGAMTAAAIHTVVFGSQLKSISNLLDDYEKWMASVAKSTNTRVNSMYVLRDWAKFSGIYQLSVENVAENHIGNYVNRTGNSKASTRQLSLHRISAFFGWLNANGYCNRNPAKLVRIDYEKLSHEQKGSDELQPITDEEYERLLKVVDADAEDLFWRFAVRIARITALRIGDIAQLEWKVFETPFAFTLWQGKTNTKVLVEISPELVKIVLQIPREHPKWVFPNQCYTYTDEKARAGLSVQFSRLLKKAGVFGKSFHCLRHAKISEVVNTGGTLEDARKVAGHASVKTTKIYVH